MAIDIMASIDKIRQMDPFFRNDMNENLSVSEEMLSMLYSMAILRLVNGVVEKTRKKNGISIAEAADAIGIPKMLVDIRDEGSHRDLPSLQLLRLASDKALDWLVSHYWEAHEGSIAVQTDQAANLKKKIRRSLGDVALCLKAKQTAKSVSTNIKGKGLKKQLTKSLKNVRWLYASSSAEVVYALLEFLLNALSSNIIDKLEDSQSANSTGNNQSTFDYWKSVVLKLSSKEPEFILALSKAVLEKMETDEATRFGTDGLLNSYAKSRRAELLSYLFDWLIGHLKARQQASVETTDGSKTGQPLPMETVLGLLRRSFMLLFPCGKWLKSSVVTLAEMTGDSSLLHKLKKFLDMLNLDGFSVEACNRTISQQEFNLNEAKAALEYFQQHSKQKKEGKSKQPKMRQNSKWTVAKSWNPCPIGMLPDTIGSSGRFPVLDCVDEYREEATVLVGNESSELNQCGKREARCGTEEMDGLPAKKMKETEADHMMPDQDDDTDGEGIKGRMLIGGVWKKIGKEELLALASKVRLLL